MYVFWSLGGLQAISGGGKRHDPEQLGILTPGSLSRPLSGSTRQGKVEIIYSSLHLRMDT